MADLVCRALDPILTPIGFAAGQSGYDEASFQVLYCASYDQLVERYPTISVDDHQTGLGVCADLHVNGNGYGIASVDLEGVPLEQLLLQNGHEVTLRHWSNLPAPLALDELREAITRLFDV